MSRSIHDTWGVMQRAQEADWSDPEIPRAITAEMRKNLRHQQAIREGERHVRKRGALPLQQVHPDQVPIIVDDEAPYAFHAANQEDIRAILRRLPPGSLDGLQAIHLCVDNAEAEGEPRVRDPFTGRLRYEILPGVFKSSVNGDYTPSTATIRIFAYLCDPTKLGPWALLFKMAALRTLVHEMAHHFDFAFRKNRSRWEPRDKVEEWAERIEGEQSAQIVAQYVGERYSLECNELRTWIKTHGGAALSPLVYLEDDDDDSTAPRAIRSLVRAVLAGEDRDEVGVAFARNLHEAGHNDGAFEAVKRVLARQPNHAAALAVMACIALCANRNYKAAETLCNRAVDADPTCLEAWKVLVRCYAIGQKWQDAAFACERALARVPNGIRGGWYIVETLAEAHLHLEDWTGVDADVERMRAWNTEYGPLNADVYFALGRCWSEQWEEALPLATRMLAIEKYEPWHLWLGAVQFECAHRLGRKHLAGGFTRADLDKLQGEDFAADWVLRIRSFVETGSS